MEIVHWTISGRSSPPSGGRVWGVTSRPSTGGVEGLKQFAVKLLTRKFGKVTLKMVKRLDKLSAEQLEELAEAVLDFKKVTDLEAWLVSRK